MDKEIIGAPLTASELRDINEVSLDRKTADETLRLALNHHSNCMNIYYKRSKKWWDDALSTRSIPNDMEYTINHGAPVVGIIKKSDADDAE